MLLFVLAFAVAPALPAARVTTNPSPGTARCGRTSGYYALRPGTSVTPRKLTALPDANLYVAVDRRVGGCAAPIVVRYKMTGR